MSGESPFARGTLAEDIGLDGKGDAVDGILQGKFKRDLSGLDKALASSEMKTFIQALQIPTSIETGKPIKTMPVTFTNEDYVE